MPDCQTAQLSMQLQFSNKVERGNIKKKYLNNLTMIVVRLVTIRNGFLATSRPSRELRSSFEV